MNIPLFKLLTSLGLWVISVVCGILPLVLRNFNTNKFLISISQCFAGGLFIAIGLIHVLPEAHEKLEGFEEGEGHGSKFPLSYFICLSTFSLILLIDKVLFNNTDIIEEIEQKVDGRSSLMRKSILSHKDNDPQENFQEKVSHNMKFALSMSKLNIQIKNDEEEEQYFEIPPEKLETQNKKNISVEKLGAKIPEHVKADDGQQLVIADYKPMVNKNSPHENLHKVPSPPHDHVHPHKGGHHDHHGHHHAAVKKGASYTSALIILAAMGIHSLFEGLAYGVSETKEEVLSMFFAIAAHKWCDSVVVGISFVSAELPFKMSLYLSLFLSLFTPLGIIIGYCASENRILTGVFYAISAGTFLYISCAEIIIEEFAIADQKTWKFFMYTLGIAFVSVMTLFEH